MTVSFLRWLILYHSTIGLQSWRNRKGTALRTACFMCITSMTLVRVQVQMWSSACWVFEWVCSVPAFVPWSSKLTAPSPEPILNHRALIYVKPIFEHNVYLRESMRQALSTAAVSLPQSSYRNLLDRTEDVCRPRQKLSLIQPASHQENIQKVKILWESS